MARHLQNEPVVARPPSVAYRTRKLVRRHALAVAGSAFVLVAVLTGLGVSTAMYVRAETARRNSDYTAYVATLAAADADLKAGEPEQARRRLLASSPEFRDNWEWRYLFGRTDTGVAMLPALEDGGWSDDTCASGLAVSPDGHHLFLAGGHLVQSWDVENTSAPTTVYATDRAILAIDPRARLIVTTPNLHRDPVEGTEVEIVEMSTKMVISKLPARVWEAAFDPSGGQLATTSGDPTARTMTVTAWNTRSGTPVASTHTSSGGGTLTWAPDGRRLALEDFSMWRIGSPRRITLVSSPPDVAFGRCHAFSPDAAHLVTERMDDRLREWDTVSGVQTRSLATTHSGFTKMAFSPDGHFLAVGGGTELSLWAMPSGRIAAHLATPTEQGWVSGLVFSPDGRRLFALFRSRRDEPPHIRVWQMASVSGRRFPAVLRSPGSGLLNAPVDHAVAATLEFFHLPEAFLPVPGLVTASAVSADGRHAAFAVRGHVGLWSQRLERQTQIDLRSNCHAGCDGQVNRLALSGDARRLIGGTTDGAAFWSALDDRPPVVLARDDISAVAISADGSLGAASRSTGRTTVWHLASGRELLTISDAHPVGSIAFDQTGTHVLISTLILTGPWQLGLLETWDITTGHRLWQTTYREASAVSSDGKIAVGGAGSVQLLDVTSGAPAVTISLAASISSLSFSPDGRRLAAATEQSIRIWDATKGAELLRLWDPPDEPESLGLDGIRAISFSSDGERLLALADASVRVFDAASAHYPGAVELVQGLQEELVFSADVLERLRADPSLSPGLRRATIALAQASGDNPSALNLKSRRITSVRDQSPDLYRRARRMAELAVQMNPRDDESLLSLGMAQYRNGDSALALETLQKLTTVGLVEAVTVNVPAAYLKRYLVAMAQARLGRVEEARTELARLGKSLSLLQDYQRHNLQLQDVLAIQKEAEALISNTTGR